MNRRTLAMNWDGLGEDDDDDHFFEPSNRVSSAVSLDSASSGSDEEDFEDSRMSFVSTASSPSFESSKPPSAMASYDMWMSEPGDIKERRRRLLHGMGLSSTKNMLRLASNKIARAVSRKEEHAPDSVSAPVVVKPESKPAPKVVKVNDSVRRAHEASSSPSHSQVHVLVRSRSDGDIEALSAKTKQRKEELIGPISKQKLTKTLSGVCQYSSGVRIAPERVKNGLSKPNSDVLQSVVSDGGLGSFFLIKNLDTGKEFIVKEYNEKGMWNKLSDVQTGKQLTMDEFERSVGYSPAVKQLMRRKNTDNSQDDKKLNHNSYFTKSFRNSKRKGAAFLKNIKGVASSKSISHKDHENTSFEEPKAMKAPSQWVKSHQHGKSYKEFTALHMSQEIQAHEGSIWAVRFSYDARFLASAGEDKVIHVWEVQECDVMSTRPFDDLSISGGTPVHPMAAVVSERSPLAEITPMPSEKKRKGKHNKKKGSSIPDYVDVPETVFALSEKPVCTFKGHQDEVLDLAWSRSQVGY